MSEIDLHVVPLNDILAHETNGQECQCDPAVKVEGAHLIFVHHAFDGREEREPDYARSG